MPVVKLYPNGLTGGISPRPHIPKDKVRVIQCRHCTFHLSIEWFKTDEDDSVGSGKCPNCGHVYRFFVPLSKRGDCKGWTARTSRGNTRFLYSVRAPELQCSADGLLLVGVAGSLTLKDCPSSHDDWKSVRCSLFRRLRRKGLYRLHWLTEWQKRGCPHLHFAAWFHEDKVNTLCTKLKLPASALFPLIKADWLELSAPYRSQGISQSLTPITDELGWLQYLAKHASRGAAHYQRASSTIPQGWQKTGRMWGYLGDFPTQEPLGLELDRQGWFQFRRIVRAWRLANARISLGREFLEQRIKRRRIESARHMLRCGNRSLSEVRGVSEWIPFDLGLSISHWLEKNRAYGPLVAADVRRRFQAFVRSSQG